MTQIELGTMSDTQRSQINQVLHDIERLNESVKAAVNQGLTIEIARAARHHCGTGNWGDVMRPRFVATRKS
jgi:hypothetical protein